MTDPEKGNPHALIIGATRSGKSRRVIMPSIWAIGHAGESMIVTDPKGELYMHTAGWLKKQGYKVVLIDLLRPTRGNRWNPLDTIITNMKEGDTEEAVRQAWEMGHLLAWSKGAGTDPIWPQAEESLMAALFLATAMEAPEEAKHPATAYRILTELGHRGGESLDAYLESLDPGHPARRAYGTAALSESRTRSSIYTGTAAHLRTWGETGIAWLCSKSDHNPADAGKEKTAIFLLLPDEAGARRNIAAMYVNQAYSGLAQLARDNGGKLPVPVWMLLDEFGNVGKIPGMAEKLTVSAGRRIRFVLAVQALAQIEHVYGKKEAEIIRGNCDTWVYLRTTDMDTARTISQMTGQFTVRTRSVQKRQYRGVSVGETEGMAGRSLLTPDEVLRWQIGNSLLLQAGQYPARLPLQDLSDWIGANKAFTPKEIVSITKTKANPEVDTWVPKLAEEQVQERQPKKEQDAGQVKTSILEEF